MRKGNVLSFAAAVVLAGSYVSAVKADINFSGIKNYILSGGEYSASFDTNENGRADVLDICREKSKILYPEKWNTETDSEPEAVSFMEFGTAEAYYDNGFLYIPVNIARTLIDLKYIAFTVHWDPSAFSLETLDAGNVGGSWSWSLSPGKGTADVEFEIASNVMGGGKLMVAQLAVEVPLDGEYDFFITDVYALAETEDGMTELNDEECPRSSAVYRLSFDSDVPFTPQPPQDQDEPSYSVPDLPEIDGDEIYNAMTALKSDYPEGMKWTNDNSYAWNGGIFSKGYGCAGFAFILSDAAFGRLPARMIKDDELSSYNIRTGDILRMDNDSHSVIVLEKVKGGVIVAEGNYNSSVHWGRMISDSELKKLTYILTRYPD